MGGFFGAVSKNDVVLDVFFGTDYHSHLGTRRGGMAAYDKEIGLQRKIHNIENAPFRTKFEHIFEEMEGTSVIGCISDSDPQPMLIRSNLGTYAICTVGIINNVLEFFGFEYVNWMNAGSEYWANITVMIIYIVWNALPFKILILLGGLQSINKQYYDAAKVDSTPKVRVFTRITVPLLSPMLAYVIITSFIGGFKEYSSIVGIFGEDMGPAGDPGRLNTMVGYIYDSLPKMNYGQASAAALILFAIIFVVTIFNNAVIKKHVHY